MKKNEIFKLYERYVAKNYGRFPLDIVKGKGAKAWDADGNVYLDLIAGLAVNILGHSPAPVAKALAKQSLELVHTSNLFYTIPQGKLAKELVKLSFPSQALFVNSGAEAIESAIKLVRKYHHDKKSGRSEIIAMENSFHGRTYGALSLTGQKKYHKGFAPLLSGFTHVPFGNFSALKKSINKKTGAIFIEPVQGEGGVNIPPSGYLKKVRKLCDKEGILLVLDEVQCGMGRTGKWFAFKHEGITPDILTLAKGLAGGFPIGAMLAKPDVMSAFGPGTHASTFGGGPLACVCALAVIETIKKETVLKNVNAVSKETLKLLNQLKKEFSGIKEVRGKGLMIGIELKEPVGGEVVMECLNKGLILNCVHDRTIRFLPPLNVKVSEMKRGILILRKVLCQKIS